MHNNSPRMGIPPKSQTLPSIGPNTYIICDERSKLKNRVAFLSTEEKEPKFIKKTFCDTFYSVSDCSNIKLGSSPRNKAPRFIYPKEGEPGPGEYDPEEAGCPDVSRRPPTRGRLYVCRTPFTLKGCGPSVPTQINENGYFLDEEGNVVPLPPDKREACFFYDVTREPCCADRYRGCKWSERTAKRSFATPKDGPGPADYDVGVTSAKRSADDEFREMARLLTFLPRYLEAQDVKLRRENMPGPGQYDISTNRATCKICPGIFPKPFIGGSARFREHLAENPSPAAYDVAGSPEHFRTCWAPFQVGAARFSKRMSARSPGPAEYDVDGRLRKKEAVTHRAPFNNSASRDTARLKKDAADSPSPADYSVGGGKKCRILVSSVFQSRVNRFSKSCPKSNEMSPAHYDPTQAFNYTKNRHSHNILMLPFNAVDRKRGFLDSLNYDNPSPADYQSQGHLDGKGHFIPTTERFKAAKETAPGPGTHRIHPFFENNSVNKAFTSHNVKIMEEILRTPLRYRASETREKWLGDLKKRKRMRWFVNEGRGFSHCF